MPEEQQTDQPNDEPNVVTTEEPEADETPKTVPLNKYLQEKDRRRTVEDQLAEAQNASAAAAIAPVEPESEETPELSPLEEFAKENPDEAPPAEVLLEQRKFDATQADEKAAKTARTTIQKTAKEAYATAATKYSAEQVGQTLSLDRVLAVGKANLTGGDVVDFNTALRGELIVGGKRVDPMDFIYDRCITRTPELQTARADALKAAKNKPADKETTIKNVSATDEDELRTPYSDLVQEHFA